MMMTSHSDCISTAAWSSLNDSNDCMGEDWLDWRKTEHLTSGVNEECSVSGAWFDHFCYGLSLLFFERRIIQKNGVSFAIPLHSKSSGALSSLLYLMKAFHSPVSPSPVARFSSIAVRSHNLPHRSIVLAFSAISRLHYLAVETSMPEAYFTANLRQ
jgi:hypothetical protein